MYNSLMQKGNIPIMTCIKLLRMYSNDIQWYNTQEVHIGMVKNWIFYANKINSIQHLYQIRFVTDLCVCMHQTKNTSDE